MFHRSFVLTTLAMALTMFLSCFAAPQATQRPEAVSPKILPAPQTSVASTDFNPGLTNAGGTTNSAGTFNVQSLARSSSYAWDSNLPKTTSFVASGASFAPEESKSTPAYYSDAGKTSSTSTVTQQQSSATQSSISLAPDSASVIAASFVENGASDIRIGWHGTTGALGTTLLIGCGALIGALILI